MSSATITSKAAIPEHVTDQARPGPWWFVWLSLVFLFGGLADGVLPMVVQQPVTVTVGFVFVVTGGLQLAHVVAQRNWTGSIWQALAGAVALIGGAALMANPGMDAATLRLFVGAVLVAAGVLEVLFGASYRPYGGWSWMSAAGVVSVIAGGLIMISWPSPAGWILSIVAGVALMFSGWSYLLIAAAAQRLEEGDTGGHSFH